MKYRKATSLDLHLTVQTTQITLIRVNDGRVYVLDDVVSMQVTNRKIATDDNSKLIYFVEADDGSGVALQ